MVAIIIGDRNTIRTPRQKEKDDEKRIAMITLPIGFVVGGTILLSTVAMAHGGAGMIRNQDEVNSQAPCQDESYSGSMGHGMMGGMMGSGGMGSMMNNGRGGHMMDLDDMRHGSVLNQTEKLGLSDDQISKLNTLRLANEKTLSGNKQKPTWPAWNCPTWLHPTTGL